MVMYKVNVTWGKSTYDLDIDPTKGPHGLKEALENVTGVPSARMKIMAKSKGLWKGMLKDTEDFTQLDWSDGAKITMLGTAESAPKKQGEVKFIEDMTTKQQQALGKMKPAGLQNLGNTCYMNATVQCLKAIPELRRSLETVEASSATTAPKKMTVGLKKMFDAMDHAKDSYTPLEYVRLMREAFPQYAQQGPKGTGFAQQDADEFFNSLAGTLSQFLTSKVDDVDFGHENNAVDALFGIETEVTLKCKESDKEKVVVKSEKLRRLQCKIDDQVKTLEQGIQLGFEGELEKRSNVLGRNALWETKQRLNSVPLYLCVQFNRFFWKATPESRDHQGINCKINKKVTFPLEFDIYQFCDEDLKKVLQPARDTHTKKLLAAAEGAMDVEETAEERAMREALVLSTTGRTAGPGISPSFRGIYELFGVVTHIGRSVDSGHYLGWVKQGPNSWICFDDEHASECTDDDIQKLNGETVDYHIAYLAFYRVKLD